MNQSASIERMDVSVDTGHVALQGSLAVTDDARAVVVIAHGSGSPDARALDRRVAERLNESGLATLCADLLTTKEQEIDAGTGRLRFHIPLLADRLCAAVAWVGRHARTGDLPIGLFASRTGAAAALVAAANDPATVGAVVCLGGRPDLAEEALGRVLAPVLLIVGDQNKRIVQLNQMASERLEAPHRIVLVPEVKYGFEEPSRLEQVAERAAGWYHEHIALPG
jgi:predicted alpha/beta-hydrolase family hydrolase